MKPKSENFFNLPDPNNCACAVWSYNISLGLLSIKSIHRTRTDEVWWLTFLRVTYFEGPMMWLEADFEIGTPDETLTLCYKFDKNKQRSNEILLRDNQLFKVKFEVDSLDSDSVGQVRILAIKATVQQEKK